MNNIFLPVDNVSDFACYSVFDKDTIRAYYTQPQVDSSSDYIDFYINNHYLEKSGTQSWGQWSNYLPVCLPSNSITNDFYYRNDFADILIIFTIMCLFGLYLPLKIFSKLFKKGGVN